MAATVSGAVLSSLFFSQSNCKGGQEGLLFGQVIRQVRDTISDSQISNYQVETKIYIYSCRDCTGLNSFHDKRYHIKESYIEELKANNNKVVGWYRFRRNTSSRISMKETCLHMNLLKSLPKENREHILFFLCTVSPSGNMATHNFDYNLYKWSEINNKFFKVPVDVVNLGDTTHTLYRLERSCTVSPDCGAFRTVIAKYQNEMLDESGRGREIQNITALTHSLHSRLQELTKLVAESEQVLHTAEDDVDKKRKVLQSKLGEKSHNQPLLPTPTPSTVPHTELSQVETLNQKSKMSNEDAILVAKSKREQRRREGTKLTSCLHTGRSASGKTRSDLAHHSRKLSGDTEYMDTVDISRQDSLPEFSEKSAVIEESVTDQASGINDLPDLTVDNTDQVFPSVEPPKSNSKIKDKNQDGNHTNGITVSSNSKENKTNLKVNSDPFSFVSDIMKDAHSKNQRHEKAQTMLVPTGGCIKMSSTGELDNGEEEFPQRKTRSQRSQKPLQSQSNRGQRSQIKQANLKETRFKDSTAMKKETFENDNDSDTDIVKNCENKSSVPNPGKLCRQQVTTDSVQNHLLNNTNSMHGTEELIDDVEMTNVTENEFEISSSPVF